MCPKRCERLLYVVHQVLSRIGVGLAILILVVVVVVVVVVMVVMILVGVVA